MCWLSKKHTALALFVNRLLEDYGDRNCIRWLLTGTPPVGCIVLHPEHGDWNLVEVTLQDLLRMSFISQCFLDTEKLRMVHQQSYTYCFQTPLTQRHNGPGPAHSLLPVRTIAAHTIRENSRQLEEPGWLLFVSQDKRILGCLGRQESLQKTSQGLDMRGSVKQHW